VPMYLDRHKTMPMSPEVMQEVRSQMGNKQPDGITPISFIVGKDQSYCLNEADSPDLIHKHHEGMGMVLDAGAIEEVTARVP
jgi:hypothetical protein